MDSFECKFDHHRPCLAGASSKDLRLCNLGLYMCTSPTRSDLVVTAFVYIYVYFTMGNVVHSKGHFTHEPRAVTLKLWEPKWKCPKAVPRHLQNHIVWSRIFKCSVMSYVIGPSIKCYFNEVLFMRVLTHDKIEYTNGCESLEWHGLPVLW